MATLNMQDVNLPAALRAFGAAVNEELPNINAGGCCVYAAYVAERLQALGIPAWGVVGMWGGGLNLNEVREELVNNGLDPLNLHDWNNEGGVDFNHVLIQFIWRGKVYTHDSNYTRAGKARYEDTCNTEVLDGYLTIDELRAFADEPEGWNPWFHRQTGIPRLRRILRSGLSQRKLRHFSKCSRGGK